MSDANCIKARVALRSDDYYGGDVTVSHMVTFTDPDLQGNHGDEDVMIEWGVWGGYGGMSLRLTTGEARALAAAIESFGMKVY